MPRAFVVVAWSSDPGWPSSVSLSANRGGPQPRPPRYVGAAFTPATQNLGQWIGKRLDDNPESRGITHSVEKWEASNSPTTRNLTPVDVSSLHA